MASQTKNTKGPVYKARLNRLQISIFEDVAEDGQIRFSTYIQRQYKNAKGEWKTGAFSEMDLDDLAKAQKMAVKQIEDIKTRYSKQQLAA
jgi:hypothetical protein